ncbi:hypothetical protein [Armatimonas sp.]|uniref:hypothetical protein n=1 Tax=Armatimonas sp. TaxID=1872638 RepID=UPI003752FCC1
MDILFPCDYGDLTAPDPDFAIEVSAARAAGFVCHFFDFNALRAGDAYRLTKGEGALLYRGWMLSDTEYAGFYARLVARGWEPITPPTAYDEADAWELYAAQFRTQDAILKDWVKSAKYRWWVVETGDGQVAGLPGSIAPEAFYRALRLVGA